MTENIKEPIAQDIGNTQDIGDTQGSVKQSTGQSAEPFNPF